MNRYHPIAAPDTDLTINGTPIRHIYDASAMNFCAASGVPVNFRIEPRSTT